MKPIVIYAAMAALILALLPWPYAYFQLLRFFMCGLFAYAAVISVDRGGWMPWVFGAAAVLYNPIAPIHLGREMWSAVNVATAVLLAVVRKRVAI